MAALAVLATLLASCAAQEAGRGAVGDIEQSALDQAAPAVPGSESVGRPAAATDPSQLPARRQVPDATTTQGVPWRPWTFEPPPAGDRPAGVWIPVIDVWARTVELGLDEDGELQVPSDYGTTGWYVGSPRPGELGPAVIAGHVDSTDGPAVFFRMRQLTADDLVHVIYTSGYVATFRVAQVEQYDKSAFPTQRVYGDVQAPELRLITCGGSFDHASGHYRANVVAYAEMFASWRYDPQTGQV